MRWLNPVEVRTNAHETKGNDMNLAGASPPLSKLILHPHTGSIRGGGVGTVPLTCPQSWRGSPASLHPSQSPYSCPFFAMPSRCSPLKFFVPGASQTSTELRSLLRSSPVFSRVPQSSPEFPSLCWSSSLSTGVAATSSKPLSLGVLRGFFAKLPLSSESFPVVSYDAAIAS